MNSYFTTSFVPCESEFRKSSPFSITYESLPSLFTACVQGNCLTCSVYGVCTKCAFGYRPSGIDMNCIPCVSDQQFNSPEGVACVNCTLAGGCTACNMASGNCISCPAGNTTEGTGCVDCSWGTWSHAGQPACTCEFLSLSQPAFRSRPRGEQPVPWVSARGARGRESAQNATLGSSHREQTWPACRATTARSGTGHRDKTVSTARSEEAASRATWRRESARPAQRRRSSTASVA